MAKGLEMKIISTETIKPSSPTPHHLKTFKLSLLDQLAMHLYMPYMLFYKKNHESESYWDISLQLKKSLSEILTKYYPLAGRFNADGVTIDCGDQGIDFVESRICCNMSDFLNEISGERQNLLFPGGYLWKDTWRDSCLVGVQVNFFDCGGVAVCLSISHKIADGNSISTFLTDWAATACDQSNDKVMTPSFLGSSLPPLDLAFTVPEIHLEKKIKCVTRRYVFDESKISALRGMAADSGSLKKPTRVEAVTAFLYKCATAASSRKSILIQMVNMRSRVLPPLPANSIGNFSWYFTISSKDESEMNLSDIVGQLKSGMAELSGENLNLDDWLLSVRESTKEVKVLFDNLNVFRCSSFCRWPFYQVDFGWGKPEWVSMADGLVKNTFVLFDTPEGDGIEASIILEEEDMMAFQCNEDLLAFVGSGH